MVIFKNEQTLKIFGGNGEVKKLSQLTMNNRSHFITTITENVKLFVNVRSVTK